MKQTLENMGHFSFKQVSISQVEKELSESNSSKIETFPNIPTKIFEKISKSCTDTLQKLFDDTLRSDNFPDKLSQFS